MAGAFLALLRRLAGDGDTRGLRGRAFARRFATIAGAALVGDGGKLCHRSGGADRFAGFSIASRSPAWSRRPARSGAPAWTALAAGVAALAAPAAIASEALERSGGGLGWGSGATAPLTLRLAPGAVLGGRRSRRPGAGASLRFAARRGLALDAMAPRGGARPRASLGRPPAGLVGGHQPILFSVLPRWRTQAARRAKTSHKA